MQVLTGSDWSRVCPFSDLREHGGGPSGSIKSEFLDVLSKCQLLEKVLYGGVKIVKAYCCTNV